RPGDRRGGSREGRRRASRARRRGRRLAVAAGRPGSREPREGDRASAVGEGEGGDQAAHPARIPLDVPRLRAGASQVRPDRERADQARAGEARGGGEGAVELSSLTPTLSPVRGGEGISVYPLFLNTSTATSASASASAMSRSPESVGTGVTGPGPR